MLLKFIAIAFVATTVGRIFFPRQWQGFGRWFRRFVDLTLVLLVLAFGAQLLLLAAR